MNTSTLWAGVVCLVALLSAGVALLNSGLDQAAALGFLGGIITVAAGLLALYDRLTTIQRVNVVQDEKIDTVVEQTNGKLRDVVADEIAAALAARFGPVQPTSKEE